MSRPVFFFHLRETLFKDKIKHAEELGSFPVSRHQYAMAKDERHLAACRTHGVTADTHHSTLVSWRWGSRYYRTLARALPTRCLRTHTQTSSTFTMRFPYFGPRSG
ncbi:hypothetical protein E2C01_074667 [Portunus trituberculatus]|uniref:Uncharacterized protein n=1 Tax=Portunus trituberculatus TaxID=210409 RepID=A0A5B7I685_PORTR|nr:hypothetical protein [Portunus trituberculatus]